MEFLRDGSIDEDESPSETPGDVVSNTGEENADSAVELETPEAWPDQQGRKKKESNDRWLKWIQVIGEYNGYFRFQI